MGEPAEILLETEEFGAVGIGRERICVVLREGIPLELVVPVLSPERPCKSEEESQDYEGAKLHRSARAFRNSRIWSSESNLMVRVPFPDALRLRDRLSPKYRPTFSRSR